MYSCVSLVSSVAIGRSSAQRGALKLAFSMRCKIGRLATLISRPDGGRTATSRVAPRSAARPPRRVGFDRPLTTNQVASWVGNALATGLFYGLVSFVLLRQRKRCDEGALAYAVLPHAFCVCVGLCCWLFLETHPPTEPSCFSKLLPETERWTKARYCREHKSVVAGLDHFCTWLNVSVGRSNYVPFFAVAACGTAQYAVAAGGHPASRELRGSFRKRRTF